jgi:nucleotide-binding universal stress UspA family protein
VKPGDTGAPDDVGDVTVLAGRGPHAPVAARRGAEFVESDDEASLTLLNVQPSDAEDPEETGAAIVADVAESAAVDAEASTSRLLVAEDVRETLLAETAAADIVCVGATRATSVSQALFGSLPETIGREVPGTVVICRGGESSPRSIRQAIVERLSEEPSTVGSHSQ